MGSSYASDRVHSSYISCEKSCSTGRVILAIGTELGTFACGICWWQPGRFHDDQFLWRRHETMRRFVYESPAAEIARHMMRYLVISTVSACFPYSSL